MLLRYPRKYFEELYDQGLSQTVFTTRNCILITVLPNREAADWKIYRLRRSAKFSGSRDLNPW
jgi:hypothetical protein